MKITDYDCTIEGGNIVFRPTVESDNEIGETVALTAFRIINTYRINLYLWEAIIDCIVAKIVVDNAIFEEKILKEIENLKKEIKMLKERSIN